MARSIARSWIALAIVVALAIGVTGRAVVAADMALGMMTISADGVGDCGDCGNGDAGMAASLCHLVCGNPASIGDESALPQQAATRLRDRDAGALAAGRVLTPDPSPPKASPLS